MEIKEIRTLYNIRPFRPFTIHLADGGKIPVKHPELIAIAPSGHTIVVFQPGDSFNIIDLSLVTNLEVKTDTS